MSDMPVLQVINSSPMASSLEIAEYFGKDHYNVLQSIRNLIDELPEKFAYLNFERGEYFDPTGRSLPMYYLAKDGVSLLVMGFTGSAALGRKLKYIEAFNLMAHDESGPGNGRAKGDLSPEERNAIKRLPQPLQREALRSFAMFAAKNPDNVDSFCRGLLTLCNAFAPDPEAEPPMVAQFWNAVSTVEESGHEINHSLDPALVAVSLPELVTLANECGFSFPLNELRRVLTESRRYPFMARKTIRSSIATGKNVHCWVFRRQS